ncbi:phosphatase PAP2 family protein [Peribacillus kribbensis]|uniref:phosphatase PAP2 family protein n=1 Tax=Peribacillus kribbensis TaxID=356658 RepID=UPI00041693D6|nr:phosphatase PAP2 family protein [Peribacillus kribbensis]
MLNKVKNKFPFLLLMLVHPLLGFIYKLLNENPRKAANITTAFDQHIPFVPVFILPYMIWYGYIFGYLIYFCFKDTKVYIKSLITITIGECICFIVFFFFQTTVIRPEITEGTPLYDLVSFIYKSDMPYNCFPSIHVLTTYAIMLASLHIKNKHIIHSILIQGMGSLIILSTMFVKQHVVWDMVGSMILVCYIYGITFEIFKIRVSEKAKTIEIKND